MARNSILSGNIEKAEKYFSGNLEFFKKEKEILWLARSYMVQSHIHKEKGQLKQAITSNRKYDSLLQRLENPRDKILTYNLYSRLYQLSGNYEKAKQYADSTVHFSLQLKDSVELLNGYESLSKMAIKEDNFNEAAKYSSLAFPIKEGSAKVRSGQPLDDEVDYDLPIWAGELPLKLTASIPIADPKLASEIAIPENLINYFRGV